MGKRASFSCRVSLGGLCFVISSADHALLPEEDESYRRFSLEPEKFADGDPVAVRLSVAEIRAPAGRLLFDGGPWRIYAEGDDRRLVIRHPTLPDPLCEARFRPGSPDVELVCAPRLLETRDGSTGIRSQFRYPLDQIVAMYLLGGRGLILHAAGFVFRGRGLALPGVSGAGKSTITRLAQGRAGLRCLSDDRVILRADDDTVAVHGTPWPGETGIAECLHARARQLLFLEQGDRNGVRAISPRETLARLLPTVSLPWFDARHLESGLRACDDVISRLPAGVFTFRDDAGAVEALETFLESRGGTEGTVR